MTCATIRAVSGLDPGLYEALLTRFLARQLPIDEQLRWLQPLDRGDAPTVLARYVSSILEMMLGSPGLESDVSAQTELCNNLLDLLASRVAAVQRGEDLIELPA